MTFKLPFRTVLGDLSRLGFVSAAIGAFLVASAFGEEEVDAPGHFEIAFEERGLVELRRVNDAHDTNYIAAGRALGEEVLIRYREAPEAPWKTLAGDVEGVTEASGHFRLRHLGSDSLELSQTFRVEDDRLEWEIALSNPTEGPLEIGDLAVPMVFAEETPRERGRIYTQKVIRHSFISVHGSWIYWSRANAVGPYLVMTSAADTKFEYVDNSARAFTPYIHATVASQDPIARARDFGGAAEPWRFPLTSLELAPGATETYQFTFRFAEDAEGVREVLYEENLFDVNILPGMSLPIDLPAMISLRTRVEISAIEAEFPDRTKIEYLGERSPDNHVYRVEFDKLGENLLWVRYGEDRMMSLEFFVMEPLETVISKRARFLTETQQHADPEKPWYGAYGDWDQVERVLRNPEDRDGLRPWLVDSSDDAGNARPAFVAAKNVFLPVASEVESVERYIRHYLWNDLEDGKGGMQMTENELYPYGIYGTFDNWWGHRASDDPGRDGRAHLWRIYDYPHIIHLYFRMYQIASYYPELVSWRNADEYLELAYRTAKAYWEVPLEIEGWSANSVATMGEAFLPELIDALAAEGKVEWSNEIRAFWESKVLRFLKNPPNLYGSEFSFDSTGFESTQAFARYALERLENFEDHGVTREQVEEFARFQMDLNLCVRGWVETTFYQLGTDYRNQMSYLLSYMSHLGGWGVMDEALRSTEDAAGLLRLGYASSLSAWALVNSGTEESDYGYWYPGKENDGAAGGGFIPEAWGRGWIGKDMPRGAWYYSAEQDVGYVGALRTHRSILTDDPLFGEVALGGTMEREGELVKVVPRDGLGARFHVVRDDQRLDVIFERDRFASGEPVVVSDSLDLLEFTAESRGGPAHTGLVSVGGLPPGGYICTIAGESSTLLVEGQEKITIHLPMPQRGRIHVRLRRQP